MEASVTINPSLTLTIPTSTISLNLDPSTTTFNYQDLSISVGTNNPTGYKLTMSGLDKSGNPTTDLVNTEDDTKTIPTLSSGTYDESTFEVNKWGYKKDNSSFIPFVSGIILLQNDLPTNNDSTTLRFASKIDYNQPAGTYNMTLSFNAVTNPLCATMIGITYDFDYTGEEQTFVAPCDGYYKLETWGAQGGNASGASSSVGGYGAYAMGISEIAKDKTLFVYVGGGGDIRNSDGSITEIGNGYNGGGGTGYQNHSAHTYKGIYYSGGGGGATHISDVSGLLQNLSAYKGTLVSNSYYISDNIYIVAGGGGAAQASINDTRGNLWYGNGGNAGGIIGSSQPTNGNNAGKGGQQTAAGATYGVPSQMSIAIVHEANFGLGCEGAVVGTSLNFSTHISGGAGWFGGGCTVHSANVGGAGGSSYIASSKLISSSSITKHMACYSCITSSATETYTISNTDYSDTPTADYSKVGNGYARITYLGMDT